LDGEKGIITFTYLVSDHDGSGDGLGMSQYHFVRDKSHSIIEIMRGFSTDLKTAKRFNGYQIKVKKTFCRSNKVSDKYSSEEEDLKKQAKTLYENMTVHIQNSSNNKFGGTALL
jgi:hypothetical protein